MQDVKKVSEYQINHRATTRFRYGNKTPGVYNHFTSMVAAHIQKFISGRCSAYEKLVRQREANS